MDESGTRTEPEKIAPRHRYRFYASAIISSIGFFCLLLGTYAVFMINGLSDRASGFYSMLFKSGGVTAMIVAPALGLLQCIYGLARYLPKGDTGYQKHLFSFLISLLILAISFGLMVHLSSITA